MSTEPITLNLPSGSLVYVVNGYSNLITERTQKAHAKRLRQSMYPELDKDRAFGSRREACAYIVSRAEDEVVAAQKELRKAQKRLTETLKKFGRQEGSDG